MSSENAEPLPAPNFYAKRSGELRAASNSSAERYSSYTQVLIVVALFGCAAFYLSLVSKRLPLWAAFLVIPLGASVVQRRHRCHLHFVQLCNLLAYYDMGTARLTHQWDQLDGGDKFLDQDHFYAKDPDLFGYGSMY